MRKAQLGRIDVKPVGGGANHTGVVTALDTEDQASWLGVERAQWRYAEIYLNFTPGQWAHIEYMVQFMLLKETWCK